MGRRGPVARHSASFLTCTGGTCVAPPLRSRAVEGGDEMLTGLEQFLFGNFKRMPAGVRVVAYLFFLFLFGYLTVVPRFVNGQLVIASKNGGARPYRGGELAMHVDGRV